MVDRSIKYPLLTGAVNNKRAADAQSTGYFSTHVGLDGNVCAVREDVKSSIFDGNSAVSAVDNSAWAPVLRAAGWDDYRNETERSQASESDSKHFP